MGKRKFRGVAASALATGVAAAAAMTYRHHRRQNVVVTLFSEPHYGGIRQTFGYDEKAHAVSTTRLPRVGSIRVQRVNYTYRRAYDLLPLLRGAFSNNKEDREWYGSYAFLALARLIEPSSWLAERDPAGDVQSWVRLWAERPTSPPARYDEAERRGAEPWRNFLENTPDVGAWGTRTRYIEASVRNPSRGGEAVPMPPGWPPGYPLPLDIVE